MLLFGTGEYYNRYKIWFCEDDIVALVDNSKDKQGTFIDGKLVIAPEDCKKYDFDEIFILSFYVDSMRKQLVDFGIEENHIHHFYELHDFLDIPKVKKEVSYEGYEINSETGQILLLNQDLTLGGPALALYNMAICLKNQGYRVVYGSQIDGPLHRILIENGIPVVVDNNMLVATMDECPWVYNFKLVICNTINFHVFLSKRDISVPVIWWLHDATFFYEGINRKAMEEISDKNLTVFAVGDISINALHLYRSDLKIHNLIYGVEDARSRQKLTFLTIGYVEFRKGQDVLIEAIKVLPAEVRNKIEFKIIGRTTSTFAQELMNTAGKMPEIEFLGLMNRDELQQILKMSDVLVCPSREDPMPTVCAEAMMNYIPCIVSDFTGISSYIENYINGLIFTSEDAQQLADRICWTVEHENQIKSMGIEARRTFEKVFSMTTHNKNIKNILKEFDVM